MCAEGGPQRILVQHVEVPLQGTCNNYNATWGVAPGYDEAGLSGLRNDVIGIKRQALKAGL